MQPVYVEDLAEQVAAAGQSDESFIADAVGPEVYTFNELVRLVAEKVGSRAKIVHIHPRLALFLSRLMGYLLRDVVLTREELEGLAANLLVSAGPPTGQTRLSQWLEENRDRVGATYTSEMRRHHR